MWKQGVCVVGPEMSFNYCDYVLVTRGFIIIIIIIVVQILKLSLSIIYDVLIISENLFLWYLASLNLIIFK